MSEGYCLYKGEILRAEKDGGSIRIIAEHEKPGLEKATDEHGREAWQGCVPADECDDYWEAFMRANVNGEMVDIRLSSEGNWIISTSNEKTAHKLNMMGKDHSREMTTTEMLGCLFEIRYRHLDSSLDEDIRADVWNFLRIVDSLPDRETANHLAYRQVITTVLQGRYGMPERDAARTFAKLARNDGPFDELVYLCQYGKLWQGVYMCSGPFRAPSVDEATAIRYLEYLSRIKGDFSEPKMVTMPFSRARLVDRVLSAENTKRRMKITVAWVIFSAVMLLLMVYARKLFTDFSWSIVSMILYASYAVGTVSMTERWKQKMRGDDDTAYSGVVINRFHCRKRFRQEEFVRVRVSHNDVWEVRLSQQMKDSIRIGDAVLVSAQKDATVVVPDLRIRKRNERDITCEGQEGL